MMVSNKNQLVQQILDNREAPGIIKELNSALETEMQKRQAFYDAMSTEELKTEFINGEVIVHSPVKKQHNDISFSLAMIFEIYADKYDLGYIGYEKIMISLTRNDYEPDVCFFKKEIAVSFTDTQSLFPAPSLAVEVLSKNTAGRDRGIKMQDYAAHGVEEYWIIDPRTKTVEQYFNEDGSFYLHKKSDEGMISCKAITNLTFQIVAIFDKKERRKFIAELTK
ncbi:MAG: Uma2 family endonuclease [Bacteroidota bacterium]